MIDNSKQKMSLPSNKYSHCTTQYKEGKIYGPYTGRMRRIASLKGGAENLEQKLHMYDVKVITLDQINWQENYQAHLKKQN